MTLRGTAGDARGRAAGVAAMVAVDLGHVRAQAMGNRGLEADALRLSLRQSADCPTG